MKLLVIFLIISGVSANEPICDRTSRKCYQTVSDLADFSTAESKCSSLSGNLTSVENAFENAFINGLAHAYFGQSQSSFWIGANDFSNAWNWVDGSDWTYTNWASGEPSQTTCAAVTMNTGKWITSQPNEKRPFICVVPPPKVAYCETGWLINHATLSCYRYNGFVNSLSGEQRCVDDEAHLTSIHSLEEQQIIVGMHAHKQFSSPFLKEVTRMSLDQCQESIRWSTMRYSMKERDQDLTRSCCYKDL